MATAVRRAGRVRAFRLRPMLEALSAAVAAGEVQPERGELEALKVICRRSGVEFPRELAIALERMR